MRTNTAVWINVLGDSTGLQLNALEPLGRQRASLTRPTPMELLQGAAERTAEIRPVSARRV